MNEHLRERDRERLCVRALNKQKSAIVSEKQARERDGETINKEMLKLSITNNMNNDKIPGKKKREER